MQLVHLTCPRCSASLPPREPTGEYQCDYCGTRFQGVAAAPPPPPPPPPMAPPYQPHPPMPMHLSGPVVHQGGGRSRAGCVSVIMTFVVVAIAGGVMTWTTRSNFSGDSGFPSIESIANPVLAERVLWDSVGGLPAVSEAGGRELVVGRIRVFPDDQLYIAAYTAQPLESVYRVGPLGTYMEGYQNTFFLPKEGKLVVSTFRSEVVLYELATGVESKRLTLTDRVEYICDPGDSGQVWLQIADQRHLMLDLDSGALTEKPRPPKCAESRYELERQLEEANVDAVPKVEGFEASRARIDGSLAVAAGRKSPGTAIPRVVGFDPKTKKVRWNEGLATVDPNTVRERSNEFDALVGGYYVATYGAGSDRWHLTALDAESGARKWDTEMSDIFAVDSLDGLVASPGYVYVVRTSSLDVYDAKTGALVGAIGSETYE